MNVVKRRPRSINKRIRNQSYPWGTEVCLACSTGSSTDGLEGALSCNVCTTGFVKDASAKSCIPDGSSSNNERPNIIPGLQDAVFFAIVRSVGALVLSGVGALVYRSHVKKQNLRNEQEGRNIISIMSQQQQSMAKTKTNTKSMITAPYRQSRQTYSIIPNNTTTARVGTNLMSSNNPAITLSTGRRNTATIHPTTVTLPVTNTIEWTNRAANSTYSNETRTITNNTASRRV